MSSTIRIQQYILQGYNVFFMTIGTYIVYLFLKTNKKHFQKGSRYPYIHDQIIILRTYNIIYTYDIYPKEP